MRRAAGEIVVLGELVRGYRRRQGMSQEELAQAAGLSVRAVRKIETGRTGAPRPSTVRLLADALRLAGIDRDRFVSAAAGESAAQHTTTVPRQLPADVYGFTGRVAQLDELDAMLGDGRPPAILISTIGGTAGVGKTALAVHWAHRVAHRFPDGQLYVNLRGFDPSGRVTPPAEAIRWFLDALGVPAERIPADFDSQVGLYRSLLADRHVMVLLDNARDAEQVRPLLPGSRTTLVLVTSRNQLTPLVAAEGARPLNLDLLSMEEARELLVSRLSADRVAAEPDAVSKIIVACARLPLALAVAAARAAQTRLPLAAIGADLHDVGRRLDTLDAGDPTSQVRAVFSWSYASLTPPGARLFRLLGLHPGPDASVAGAASLAGCGPDEARRLLTELVHASLLTEHTPGRYTWHDLLGAYAAERARADESADERQAALARLLDYYTHTAYAADRLLSPMREPIVIALGRPLAGGVAAGPADRQEAMDWFSAEHRVLLAAVRHATDSGFHQLAWQLAWSLNTFLTNRGYFDDQDALWQIGLRAARRLGNPVAEALAHRLRAVCITRLGLHDAAKDHLQQALDLYARAGDESGQAHAHVILGFVLLSQGEPRQALHHSRHALALFRATGDQHGEARMLNNVGWCHAQLGEHAQAVHHCEQALAVFQRIGAQLGEAHTWDSLGYANHRLGHHARAAACYRQAVALHRQLDSRYDQAFSLTHLGDTLDAAGSVEDARDAWRQALEILTELDRPEADDIRSKLNRATR